MNYRTIFLYLLLMAVQVPALASPNFEIGVAAADNGPAYRVAIENFKARFAAIEGFVGVDEGRRQYFQEIQEEVRRHGGGVVDSATAALIRSDTAFKPNYLAAKNAAERWNAANGVVTSRREAAERARAEAESIEKERAQERVASVGRGVVHALGGGGESDGEYEPDDDEPQMGGAAVAAGAFYEPEERGGPAAPALGMAEVASVTRLAGRAARHARLISSPLKTAEGKEDPRHTVRKSLLRAASVVDQELMTSLVVFYDYAKLVLKRILERRGTAPENFALVDQDPFKLSALAVQRIRNVIAASQRLRVIRSEVVVTPDMPLDNVEVRFAEIQELAQRANELHALSQSLPRIKQVYWDRGFLPRTFGRQATERSLLRSAGEATLETLPHTPGRTVSANLSREDKTVIHGRFVDVMNELERTYVTASALPKAIQVRIDDAVTPETLLAAVEAYREMFETLRKEHTQALFDLSHLMAATVTPLPESPNMTALLSGISAKLKVPSRLTGSRQFQRVRAARRSLDGRDPSRRSEEALGKLAEDLRVAVEALQAGGDGEEGDIGRDLGADLEAAAEG